MNKLIWFILSFLCLILIIDMVLSFRWRMDIDSPLMFYMAYLIDKFGFIPYRDFFDLNAPGAFLVYFLMGHFIGYSDNSFRFLNVVFLIIIQTITYLWMKKINWKVAWIGVVLFGIIYLQLGPSVSLQREFFVILFITIGIWFWSFEKFNSWIKLILVGFCFGLSTTIKPPSAIGLLPIILLELCYKRTRYKSLGSTLRIILPIIAGFVVPIGVAFTYLMANDALPNFLDIVKNYWPLYASLTGEHSTILRENMPPYLLNGSEN